MGRWNYSNREKADDLKKVEISFLKKHGYLNDGWKSGDITWSRNEEKTGSISIQSFISKDESNIKFIYTQTDHDTNEKKDFDYKIQLTTTSCKFGGVRYWFICPLSKKGISCNKRVGVLYKGGDYFGCRHCYDLTYDSKNENRRYKSYPLFIMLRGYQKIEEMEKKIKRRCYAGKPTKKQKQLDKIGFKMLQLAPIVKAM